MPLEDGHFPCGRIYIYIVRDQNETFPLQNIYLSYNTALELAHELVKIYKRTFYIDVYEESLHHRKLNFGYTQEVTYEK
jgi:hypothetical protein